jgi:F-box-like
MKGLAMVQALPTEMLLNIFKFVDKVDLKSLRLVSKRFNAIAPSILFMSVNASPHTEDLEVLQLISRHDDLRHCVREIVYFEVFFHLHRNSPKQTERSDTTLQPDIHVSIIAAALARMPNLRGLILKNHWLPPRPYPGYCYSVKERKNAALYGPRTSRDFPMVKWKPYPEWKPCGIPLPRWGYVEDPFDYGFEIMRNALAISDVHLLSFSVDYSLEYDPDYNCKYNARAPSGLWESTFSKMSPRGLKYACNAFRHLRKISLSLGRDFFYLSFQSDGKHSLAKILAAAHNLEELKLKFGNNCRESSLIDLLGTYTWPHLRSLYLDLNHVDEKELTDFVWRHHKTLKSLHLLQIQLENGGNWWTWAESVQPWISSSLEQIEFVSSWYKRLRKKDRRRYCVKPAWRVSECCLRNFMLLGHYKRNCCHASRKMSNQHWTDKELISALKVSEQIFIL